MQNRLSVIYRQPVAFYYIEYRLNLFFDQIVVAGLGVADDQFAEEACQEKHTAEYHHQDSDVEIGVRTQ